MKNQIVPLTEGKYKVFGVSDDAIIFSTKNHNNFESLQEATEKSGLLESVFIILLYTVTGIRYNEENKGFDIVYDEAGDEKTLSVVPQDASERNSIAEALAGIKGFEPEQSEESKTKPLLLNLLYIAITVYVTWVGRQIAIDAEHGQHFVATGRKSGIKNLLAGIAEKLGPNGVIMAGVIVALFLIFLAYQRFNKPATEVKYS